MCKCGALLKAINAYIAKVDNDLKEQLEEEGFADAEATVEVMSDLEEDIASTLKAETKLLTTDILDEDVDDLEAFYDEKWPELLADDDTDEQLKKTFEEEFKKEVPKLTKLYVAETDTGIEVERLTNRTTAWIRDWSEELGKIMKLSSTDSLEKILIEALDEGLSVSEVTNKILASGIRDEYKRARTVALTEVLRSHNVARQESFMQSPAVESKSWVHTGAGVTSRANHVAMNGQTVDKDKPFILISAEGVTYYPMYPVDTCLPVGESANCHCFASGNTSDKILGLSLDDRKKLQKKAIEEDDAAWEKELNERNKAKAGIDEKTVRYDWLRSKSKEEQIKYLGSKNRWALVESGVITDDEGLAKLYKTTTTSSGKKVTTRKTLKELKNDGIITVHKYDAGRAGMKRSIVHSTVGEFTNTNRLEKGGHSQTNINKLNELGIEYTVVHTYGNGVRIGNVTDHKNKKKGPGTTGQSWFPEDWSDDDILVGATYIINNYSLSPNEVLFADYNNVRFGIYSDIEGNPSTIFPDAGSQYSKKGEKEIYDEQ